MQSVVVVLPSDPVLFDFSAVWSVFALCPPGLYGLRTCASTRGPVTVHDRMALTVESDLGALDAADLVIVPGVMDYERPQPAVLLQALRRARARGARVASVCTGAFVLAQAGLLDGRRATTHWARAELLARRFPKVTVDPKVLYIDEGEILTAAGVTASIDLCLHILRSDHGTALANRVARHLVFGPHRSGGQAQYIKRPLEPARSLSLEPTRAWLLDQLERPVTVPEMASHACLSVRAFARRFQEETGTSPHQWLILQRLQRARALLEDSDLPVEQIATRCGFGSALSFRQHFRRHVGACPTDYRRTFRRGSSDAERERRRAPVTPRPAPRRHQPVPA